MEVEKTELFGGLRFRKKHTVRSLKSANKWKKFYEPQYYVKVDKEKGKSGCYNVYLRRK